MKSTKMPEELQLLTEWKNMLNLNDWYILLKTQCDPDKMEVPDSDGVVSYTESTKSAIIQIVDPDKTAGRIRPFNFEETLVHELLHLKLALVAEGEDWDNDLQLRVLHQQIDELSRILVKLKRGNDGISN